MEVVTFHLYLTHANNIETNTSITILIIQFKRFIVHYTDWFIYTRCPSKEIHRVISSVVIEIIKFYSVKDSQYQQL